MTVHGSAATLASLKHDVFNDRVWPDFVKLSEKGTQFVRLEALEPGRPVEAGGLRLTPLAVDHVVPTLGFLVESPGAMVAIPSDTRPTDSFWLAAAASPGSEGRFPGGVVSRRHVRAGEDLRPPDARHVRGRGAKLSRSVPFIAVHIKPRFYEQVVAELHALNMPGLRIGRPGEVYEF